MKKWIIAIIVVVLAVSGGIAYKKHSSTLKKTKTAKKVVHKKDKRIFAIGEVGAKNIYKVSSQINGRLLKVFTDVGRYVKKGDIIAKIDPVDLPQIIQQNRDLLKKAYIESKLAKQSIKTLSPKLKLSEITFKRYSNLYKKGYVAKVEYDTAKSNLDSTLSQMKEAKLRLQSSEVEIARIKKVIATSEEKLKRYAIYAPQSGYVVTKNASLGDVVAPGYTIVEIVNPKDVWVRAYVDEGISGKLQKGDNAGIVLRSMQKKTLKGYIARIEPVSDKITQERVIDVKFDKTPQPFFLNEQAEVYIRAGEK